MKKSIGVALGASRERSFPYGALGCPKLFGFVLGVTWLATPEVARAEVAPAAEHPAAEQPDAAIPSTSKVDAPELALGATPTQSDGAEPTTTSSDGSPTSQRLEVDSLEPNEAMHLAVYLQLLGSPILVGGAFSLRPMDNLAVDVGVGWFDVCLFSCVEAFVPNIGVSWLSGNNHNLELGVTASVILRTDSSAGTESPRAFFGPLAGYRYQPTDGGFFFRATLQGLINGVEPAILPWPGVSLGATWDL